VVVELLVVLAVLVVLEVEEFVVVVKLPVEVEDVE
jgi:hypothetical protein